MADLTSTQVSKKLQEWLLEEEDNWKFAKIKDPGNFLHLQLKSLNGRNLHVLLDEVHDRVFMLAKMGPNEMQKRAFLLLPPLDKKRFGPNLMMILLQLGIAPSRDLGTNIEEIVLQKFLYFDGLTKHEFFDSVYVIWRGIETIQEFYNALPDVPSDNHSLK